MKTVLITGGTGLIGSAITKALTGKGDQVIILTRNKKQHKSSRGIEFAEWNITKQVIDPEAIMKADAIIHLAGANVAGKRWTEKRKKEILNSRVQSGQLLVKALDTIPNKVKCVVAASGIGWYGADPEIPNPFPFREQDPHAKDFLGSTCGLWESSIEPVTELGKRLVILRTGIVLSNDGGAYPEFKRPIRFGVVPILGKGNQVISWIHITDLVRLYIHAIESENMAGIYNAVTPNPVSNKTLMKEMAGQFAKASLTFPVPALALKALLGEMSIEVLKSSTVSSGKLEALGFTFMFPNVGTAVYNLKEKVS